MVTRFKPLTCILLLCILLSIFSGAVYPENYKTVKYAKTTQNSNENKEGLVSATARSSTKTTLIQKNGYKQRDYWPTKDWKVSTPEKQGMDSKLLSGIETYIDSRLYGSIGSLIVVRNGYITYEKYYNSNGKNELSDLWSATKGVTSALVGIAINKGYIKSVNQKVVDYFPEYFTSKTDPKKRELTIWHLLTMSAGLKSIEDVVWGWMDSDDWF